MLDKKILEDFTAVFFEFTKSLLRVVNNSLLLSHVQVVVILGHQCIDVGLEELILCLRNNDKKVSELLTALTHSFNELSSAEVGLIVDVVSIVFHCEVASFFLL